MCVILVLQPTVLPLKEKLVNSTYNNPHGYGLILKDKKKGEIVDVIRECPNENDPEVIYKLLVDNKKYERYLHLRWKTEGEISLVNTQPFKVFDKAGREIWFMHNGTLLDWARPPTGLGLVWDKNTGVYKQANEITDESLKEASDSRRYAELELTPLLSRMISPTENVVADIHDPVIQEILKRSWKNNTSRGILIANNQSPLFFSASSWKTVKGEDDKEFFASNDDYFDRVTRGPEKARRDEEDRKKREADNKNNLPVVIRNNEVLKITCPSFRKIYGLGPKASDLFTDWSLWSPDGFVALANLSESELVEIVKGIDSERDMAALLLTLTGLLKATGDENIQLKEKNERATKHIEELVKKNKELEGNALVKQSIRTDGKPGFKAEIKSTKECQDVHIG